MADIKSDGVFLKIPEIGDVQSTGPTGRRTLVRAIWGARVVSWISVLFVWQLLSTFVVEPFILPPPGIIFQEMINLAVSGELYAAFWESVSKLIVAVAIIMVAGGILGTIMGVSAWWEDFLRDGLSVATSLPGLVYVLLMLLVLGLGNLAHIAATLLAVSPFVAIQFWEGVRAVPTDLREMASSFRMPRGTVLRHVVFPSLIPYLLTAIMHGFSIGWRVIVLSEVFGGSSGIGNMMRREFSYFRVRGIMAWALYFFLLTLLLDRGLFLPVSRYVLRWRG